MNIDPFRRGELTGMIYARMLRFLEEAKGDVRAADVVHWWAFWEKACMPDILAGRMFWLSLVISTCMKGDFVRGEKLFMDLTDWLVGKDDTRAEIIILEDDDEPSVN